MAGVKSWHALSRLQVLWWHLRQAQRSSASGLCLVQVGDDYQAQPAHLRDTAKGRKGKHTDRRVWGSPFCLKRVAFDVSIVNPPAVSHSGAGAVTWHVASPFSTRMQGPGPGTRSRGVDGSRPDLPVQRRRKLTSTNSYASSVVWTSYRSSSQRVGGWGSSSESSDSDSTGTHTGLWWQLSSS
jgi:hypothetical protein